MNLIITEKVDAASQVAEALFKIGQKGKDLLDSATKIKSKCNKKGFIESDNYIVVWTNGHTGVDLRPDKLNPSYGLKFKFDPNFDYKIPTLLSEMKRVVRPDKKRIVDNIKSLLKKYNFNRIYICTDADAEGERIARDVLFEFSKISKNMDIRRMWITGAFSNPEMIKDQLENALPFNDDKYERLYDVQVCRSKGDYIQGMKPTKALVDIYGEKLYSGRVKNTIIGLIGDRELEIKNFKPKPYWNIQGLKDKLKFQNFYFKEIEDVDKNGNIVTKNAKTTQYFDRLLKDKVIKDVEDVNLEGIITKKQIKTSTTKERPLPLSGDDFKAKMAEKYGLSLEESGKILQYLRDEGFTTYQGTNGRYFSKKESEDVNNAYLTALAYFKKGLNVKDKGFSLDAYLFDDKKAAKQNHPPLHLTKKIPTQKDLEKWEKSPLRKVKEGYELIAKRILVHFLEDDEYQTIKVELNINNHLFEIEGVKQTKNGWREFTGDIKKDTFFEITQDVGDKFKLDKINVIEKQTTKPKKYTELEILKTLMNVGKVLNQRIDEADDPAIKLELKKAKNILREVQGIGTDRTREIILTQLKDAKLIKYEGKNIVLTESGWTLYNALPEKLRNIVFTAKWEEDFEKIRRGEKKYEEVIKEIDDYIQETIFYILNNIDKSKQKQQTPKYEIKDTDCICPLCGGKVLDKGKVYSCENAKYENKKNVGCPFFIIKETKINVITLTDLKNLLEGKSVETPKARLTLDLKNPYYVKAEWKSDGGTKLDNGLLETPKTFKLGEKFIWKNIFGKKLTPKQAKDLLEGKEIELKRKSKANKDYKVKVKYDGKGGVENLGFVNDK